ncbi:hypothetical protein F4777DRAFT_561471 [Nemania sp. FL0916]|nr:hypothetical protein F4777DRAFT_561471 [Nemania sp. FL0916]
MMARAGISPSVVISDSEPDDVISPTAFRSRKIIDSTTPTRLSSGTGQTELTSIPASTPSRTSQGPPSRSAAQDARGGTMSSYWSAGTAKSAALHDDAKSPLNHQQFSSQRTPRIQTPKKSEVTSAKIEASLQEFAQEIRVNHAKLTGRVLYDNWKRNAPERKLISKKDWFAGVKLDPLIPGIKSEGMRIKTKQVGQGRSSKQEKRDRYPVVCIKTDQEPTPRYSFHHVEIKKNILSPNTMLTYVPHLRDLADNEEGVYRRWLENLETMDKTSGFATLSRHEKVVKTIQKERATTLLEYLDCWLAKLGIEHCTKAALIRHVATQSDAVTPQQKSSILNSYSDETSSPRSARTVRMFKDAFDRVFNNKELGEHAVPLRDVLLLDRSVDTVVDSKKYVKDTPSQAKTTEEDKSEVESFLETYSLLGCLVCASHSCEHGEYGVDNERKRFSVEVIGGLSPMIRQQLTQRFRDAKNNGDSPLATVACGEECFLKLRPGTRSRPWNETEVLLLKSFFLSFHGTSIPVQCSTAVATGRPCWDVQRQMDKLDLSLPDVFEPAPVQARPLPWYDRHKKMLIGDWQEHTKTHEHQRKDHFDPCHHDGPCDRNCPCVQNRIMCEKLCRCTAETCANKFTGCACHSLGKTCTTKQKDRPCICVMLNRECDPALCGSCGADERAMPKNIDDEHLHAVGCQNCALQRGKSKAVVLGKSKISGYGLFTTEDIAQDEFVIEYVGELISQDEGVRREARRGDVFDESSNSSYLFTLLEQEGIWVDAAIYGNLSRYINHQDSNCNVTPKIMYVNGEYRIKFTSLRDIRAGEELFFHYGENFPNLTKKLLQEEKAEKKRRKAKEQAAISENGEKTRKKPGRKPGKKPGRKPGRKPKKTFASLESEGELDDINDEPMENPFVNIDPPAQRKRKRVPITDSDSGEYRPDIVDSQDDTQSGNQSGTAPPVPTRLPAPRYTSVRKLKRKRLPNGTFAAGGFVNRSKTTEDEGSSPGPPAQNSPTVPGDVSTTAADGDPQEPAIATPKRRGRKPKNRNIPLVKDESISGIQEGNDDNARASIYNSNRYSHTEARLELDEGSDLVETPSRLVRTRRSDNQTAESSPLSTPGGSGLNFNLTEPDASESDVPQPRKRGRKRKVGTGDDEYNGSSWTDSDGVKHLGGGDDSDEDDSGPIDRRRRRRRPARYED